MQEAGEKTDRDKEFGQHGQHTDGNNTSHCCAGQCSNGRNNSLIVRGRKGSGFDGHVTLGFIRNSLQLFNPVYFSAK